MRQLGYADIFWTLLSAQVGMFVGGFAIAFAYLVINLRYATSNGAFQRYGALPRPFHFDGIAASGAACVLLALNRARLNALAMGSGIDAAMYVVGILLLPFITQKYVVQPNELALETPYLSK
jgi:uncharacterized membrane protein (UPF0182 family)